MLNLIKALTPTRFFGLRLFHSSSIVNVTEKSPLFLLRQKTGLAYSLCREALNKHENNVEEAEGWLKAHALAHGIQKASKVRDRATKEGLVCLSVPKDNNLATVVELNCETDFVARNQMFKDFAVEMTEQISTTYSESLKVEEVEEGKGLISSLKPSEERLQSFQEQIAPLIAKLGENIKLTRAFHLHSTHSNIRLFGQIHAQSMKKVTESHNISAGRFGSIVALQLNEPSNSNQNQLHLIGNRLCQHVIGYSPSYIELPENIRKHLERVEEEKKNQTPEVTDEIEEEEHGDAENSKNQSGNRDDWPSIMDQTLIMTDDQTVRDFCRYNNISIVYFTRFECGIESC